MKCPHCNKEFNSKYETEELAGELLLLFHLDIEGHRASGDQYWKSAMAGADWILKNFTRKEN